jgi:hypothetical protein
MFPFIDSALRPLQSSGDDRYTSSDNCHATNYRQMLSVLSSDFSGGIYHDSPCVVVGLCCNVWTISGNQK